MTCSTQNPPPDDLHVPGHVLDLPYIYVNCARLSFKETEGIGHLAKARKGDAALYLGEAHYGKVATIEKKVRQSKSLNFFLSICSHVLPLRTLC